MTDAAARRVLVTGGGRGLGAAIVHALAAAGHDVTFTYRSAHAEAEELKTSLSAAHPGRTFAAHEVDLADKAAVDAFAEALAKEAPYGGFVHNAGQSYDTLAVMLDQAKAEAAMQVNFWSFTRLATALVRPMMRAKDGRVAVIGSVTALRRTRATPPMRPRRPPCSATCAPSRSRSRAAASPSTTSRRASSTPTCSRNTPSSATRSKAQIPARRFATPDDIAGDRRLPDVARRRLHHRRRPAG